MTQAKKTRANGRARREAILVAALEVFAERGHRGTNLTEIASRAGITQPGLLHHFATQEELLLEVVEIQEARTAEVVDTYLPRDNFRFQQAIENLGTLNQNQRIEQLLLATLTSEAVPAGHPLHQYFVRTYRDRRKRLATTLRSEQTAGRIRADVDPAAMAREVLATLDGLRLQWLLDPSTISLKKALSAYAARLARTLAP